MYRYKVTLKSGWELTVKSDYIDLLTIHSMMNDNDPFIKICDYVLAKDTIAIIEKLETTKKEN